MEKHIASHDLSDMMIFEGMHEQSQRFHIKQSFVTVRKTIDVLYSKIEHLFKRSKQGQAVQALQFEEPDLGSTATAIYSICVASVLISFFWLSLLLSPTL